MSRRNPDPKPHRRVRVSIPEKAGPHVRLIFAEMARQGRTYDWMEERSGVRRVALKAWRHKNYPSLQSIEAALGALGWDFLPVPRKAMPEDVTKQLEPVAESLSLTIPQTTAVLLEIMAGIHKRFGDPRQDVVVPIPTTRKRRVRWAPHPDQVPLLEVTANVAA